MLIAQTPPWQTSDKLAALALAVSLVAVLISILAYKKQKRQIELVEDQARDRQIDYANEVRKASPLYRKFEDGFGVIEGLGRVDVVLGSIMQKMMKDDYGDEIIEGCIVMENTIPENKAINARVVPLKLPVGSLLGEKLVELPPKDLYTEGPLTCIKLSAPASSFVKKDHLEFRLEFQSIDGHVVKSAYRYQLGSGDLEQLN